VNVREVGQWLSVLLKLGAVVVGLLAAWRWYRSAKASPGAEAANWNRRAAITTAVSVLLQGMALTIDLWAPPVAGFGG
jgi:hypothetical protein